MSAIYTQAALDAIDARLVALEVVLAKSTSFSDQQVVLRDLEDLREHRAFVARQVAAAAGRPRTRYAATSKGC